MDLKKVEWEEFEIGEIFEIEKGSNKSLSSELSQEYSIDYVGATSRNNGNVGFVNNNYIKYLKNGNCLVFINTGEGSVGDAVYKKNCFIPSNNVTIGRSKFLNEYVGQFIVTINNNQSNKYSYGYIRNEKRLKRDKIILPVYQGEPDYTFMEQFIRQKEKEKLIKYHTYVTKRIEQVKDFTEVEPIENKEWREFFFNEIFTVIQRGKRLKKEDHVKGLMPYVSSSAINNGVDGFVSNKDSVRIFDNCLSLANSGSVGATFFQPFKYVASDHITKLENTNFNEFIYIFISTITKRLSEKYSFNREINDQRIKREKIVLPIDKKGKPDYVYMENYIKKKEYEKLTKYIEGKTTNIY
ncbi:restriction endonuclease subunit S [Flavobacterium denitrificans]|uniref:restriction endonuclease subunit S n=1 Tax=Flavobacterium denitrificans TaxID=281361 RepID=UPI000412DB10|nr:restriction endonuclease subunit S [Flavobacterium denitrificans]